ncbi:DUF2835 domain-containing protein [Saccharospirillum sp. HFRX-1]|uniref:DUF2835 domain-containing protein n=1 Tax=unclassified Saccharospirillum TaxID=2633430 RepID=UPI00371829F3
MSQTLIVDLYISADDYLRHYQGSVKNVSCESRDGRRVRFPSGILQRFVTRNGIQGSFSLEVDDNFKLIGIRRIA